MQKINNFKSIKLLCANRTFSTIISDQNHNYFHYTVNFNKVTDSAWQPYEQYNILHPYIKVIINLLNYIRQFYNKQCKIHSHSCRKSLRWSQEKIKQIEESGTVLHMKYCRLQKCIQLLIEIRIISAHATTTYRIDCFNRYMQNN